jgi:hypothetical protein
MHRFRAPDILSVKAQLLFRNGRLGSGESVSTNRHPGSRPHMSRICGGD